GRGELRLRCRRTPGSYLHPDSRLSSEQGRRGPDFRRLTMIKLPPVTVLTLALVVGLGVAVLATVLAHERPYLGLKLALPPDAAAGVVVAKSGGPARNVPPGTRIVAISGGGDTVELEPLDLITEPDGALGAFSLYDRLIARQDRLARI